MTVPAFKYLQVGTNSHPRQLSVSTHPVCTHTHISNCKQHEAKFKLVCGPVSQNKKSGRYYWNLKLKKLSRNSENIAIFLFASKVTIRNAALFIHFILLYKGMDVSY